MLEEKNQSVCECRGVERRVAGAPAPHLMSDMHTHPHENLGNVRLAIGGRAMAVPGRPPDGDIWRGRDKARSSGV
ncbi:unnamed protein product [Boreogadus saida]